jgi:hypothetical protein
MTDSASALWRLRFGIVLVLFLAIAGYFLWIEHRAHLLGALVWVLVLACPILHIILHRGHGGHCHDGAGGRP